MTVASDVKQISEACGPLELEANRLYRMNHPAGRQIRATRGEVLITQTGNPNDISLKPGDSFLPAKKGLVLLEARHEASIYIEYPKPQGSAVSAVVDVVSKTDWRGFAGSQVGISSN